MSYMTELKKKMSSYHEDAVMAGQKYFPVVRSRGRELIGFTKDNERICGSMEWPWRGTKKDMVDFLKDNTDCIELWVECGYDGFESVRAAIDMDWYEPWIETWSVKVWTQKDGFIIDKPVMEEKDDFVATAW